MTDGWILSNIGDAISLIMNGLNCKQNKSGEGERISRIETVANANVNPDKVGYSVLTDEQKKKYKLEKGDILFSHINSVTHVGKTAYVDDDYDLYHGVNLLLIRSCEAVDSRFLEYYFKKLFWLGYWQTRCKQAVNQASVNQKDVKGVYFSYPPLPEQERIIAILDQCFETIEQAKTKVKRNLNNSKELFQSQLNLIFNQKDEGWVEKKLGEITAKIGSGATPRGGKSSYKESGISLIRSLNVYDDGFRKENLAFIDKEQAEKLNNVEIKKGDVLLNITGASVARCCIAPEEFMPARVNQHVSIIRLKPDILETQFLHYSLISKENKDLLLGIGEQGSTRQAITKAQIENFSISYPVQSSEQKSAVKKLDNVKSKSLELRSNYQQELDSLDELKKSILQKAFEGELSKTEIEVTI